jgi:hypothetical protein
MRTDGYTASEKEETGAECNIVREILEDSVRFYEQKPCTDKWNEQEV